MTTVLCCVMLCYVMLCYVMLCYVMLCYVMLCYFILSYLILETFGAHRSWTETLSVLSEDLTHALGSLLFCFLAT